MTRDYYQANREHIIQKTRARHEQNSTSQNYRMLQKARKQNWNIRESLSATRKKIQLLLKKLARNEHLIEELELDWGHERACRKARAKAKFIN